MDLERFSASAMQHVQSAEHAFDEVLSAWHVKPAQAEGFLLVAGALTVAAVARNAKVADAALSEMPGSVKGLTPIAQNLELPAKVDALPLLVKEGEVGFSNAASAGDRLTEAGAFKPAEQIAFQQGDHWFEGYYGRQEGNNHWVLGVSWTQPLPQLAQNVKSFEVARAEGLTVHPFDEIAGSFDRHTLETKTLIKEMLNPDMSLKPGETVVAWPGEAWAQGKFVSYSKDSGPIVEFGGWAGPMQFPSAAAMRLEKAQAAGIKFSPPYEGEMLPPDQLQWFHERLNNAPSPIPAEAFRAVPEAVRPK